MEAINHFHIQNSVALENRYATNEVNLNYGYYAKPFQNCKHIHALYQN